MFCKNCGKELADDAKFCDKCGYKMDDAEPGLASDPTLWRNIAIVIGVCVVSILIAVIYSRGGFVVGVAFGR